MGKHKDQTNLLICLTLVLITLAVYWQVFGFGFVAFDDPEYVSHNPRVLKGVSPQSVLWAFTTNTQSNWHPLTWISLMLDAQLGGGSPGVFHATNLLLHLANTLLLFLFLHSVTGYRWRSAAVSALFALHPLHVESVAWITERKDVLSTLFWLLTMFAYVRYVKHRRLTAYLLTVALFGLGLMAKPMLVSLPLVLLLMDIWPLKREQGWWRLVREKLPLFVMSAASCVVTYWAQSTGGAVSGVDLTPLGVRLANAVVVCFAYIGKMVCPLDLVVIYPHPHRSLPVWQVAGATAAFLLMFAVAILSLRRKPYVFAGWMWYLVTLLPVIGLVQVGEQGMADRYTYVPLIGLFLVLAMGVPDLLERLKLLGQPKQGTSPLLVLLGLVVLLGLGASTYYQIGYWRSSIDLYEHALTVDPQNHLAHLGMGNALLEAGRPADAVKEYATALRLNPTKGELDLPEAHFNMGVALIRLRRFREAASKLSYVVRYLPEKADAQNSLGIALGSLGRTDDAIVHFRKAVQADPSHVNALFNLGCAYGQKGQYEKAAEQFEAVLRIEPVHEDARRNLAAANAAAARQVPAPKGP